MIPHAQSNKALSLSSSLVAGLPYDDEVTFQDSSFFRKHEATSLPSPDAIRELASRSLDPGATRRTRPPPVYFPNLGLCVKWGTDVTIAEGQCLMLVHRELSQDVPVPEVYGWCKDDEQVFIYMELIDGVTLETSWEGLNERDRLAICGQLRCMIDAWRNLACASDSAFIGKSIRAPSVREITTKANDIGRQSLSKYSNFFLVY
jgi:hypothetical protein